MRHTHVCVGLASMPYGGLHGAAVRARAAQEASCEGRWHGVSVCGGLPNLTNPKTYTLGHVLARSRASASCRRRARARARRRSAWRTRRAASCASTSTAARTASAGARPAARRLAGLPAHRVPGPAVRSMQRVSERSHARGLDGARPTLRRSRGAFSVATRPAHQTRRVMRRTRRVIEHSYAHGAGKRKTGNVQVWRLSTQYRLELTISSI